MMSIPAIAQNTNYDISKDPKNGELTFRGPITFDDLFKEPSFGWLKSGVEEYKPEEHALSILREELGKYSIVVFLGTWCDDSHYLIPRLQKVFQLTGYPPGMLAVYGVDREKTTKGGEEKKYGVTLVPTIILFNSEGKEAGRITESAQKSIEADLVGIVKP